MELKKEKERANKALSNLNKINIFNYPSVLKKHFQKYCKNYYTLTKIMR